MNRLNVIGMLCFKTANCGNFSLGIETTETKVHLPSMKGMPFSNLALDYEMEAKCPVIKKMPPSEVSNSSKSCNLLAFIIKSTKVRH